VIETPPQLYIRLLLALHFDHGYAGAFGTMDDARGQPIILPAGPIFLRDRAVIAQASPGFASGFYVSGDQTAWLGW
jgi:hypothetical protein